jgi:hypothetical protein
MGGGIQYEEILTRWVKWPQLIKMETVGSKTKAMKGLYSTRLHDIDIIMQQHGVKRVLHNYLCMSRPRNFVFSVGDEIRKPNGTCTMYIVQTST